MVQSAPKESPQAQDQGKASDQRDDRACQRQRIRQPLQGRYTAGKLLRDLPEQETHQRHKQHINKRPASNRDATDTEEDRGEDEHDDERCATLPKETEEEGKRRRNERETGV